MTGVEVNIHLILIFPTALVAVIVTVFGLNDWGLICDRSKEFFCTYRAADNSLARPTSRYILFDAENISFDASLVIYINSTNI